MLPPHGSPNRPLTPPPEPPNAQRIFVVVCSFVAAGALLVALFFGVHSC